MKNSDLSRAEGNILLSNELLFECSLTPYEAAIMPNRLEYQRLGAALCDRYHVPHAYHVLCNGSDEGIETIARIHAGSTALVVVPCFERLYEVHQRYGTAVETFELTADNGYCFKDTDLDALMDKLAQGQCRRVWICNPCNPTGSIMSPDWIAQLAATYSDVTFVIDETFIEFVGREYSAASLVCSYDNVIVIGSMSKAFGMSAMRVGYLMANPAVIHQVMQQKIMFNLNTIGVRCALAALKWEGIPHEYERVKQNLETIHEWVASHTRFQMMNTTQNLNFFCIRHIDRDGTQLQEVLGQKGIKVKNLDRTLGLKEQGYCRVLVPRDAEDVDTLLSIFDSVA